MAHCTPGIGRADIAYDLRVVFGLRDFHLVSVICTVYLVRLPMFPAESEPSRWLPCLSRDSDRFSSVSISQATRSSSSIRGYIRVLSIGT